MAPGKSPLIVRASPKDHAGLPAARRVAATGFEPEGMHAKGPLLHSLRLAAIWVRQLDGKEIDERILPGAG